jgi:hypothetical protein
MDNTVTKENLSVSFVRFSLRPSLVVGPVHSQQVPYIQQKAKPGQMFPDPKPGAALEPVLLAPICQTESPAFSYFGCVEISREQSQVL